MWKYILCAFVFIILSGIADCQNCEDQPNVTVIVVASVFSTLAVVLLVFGIIFFILWKRRRGE
jgi:heme/copper-type cytochrome/quinol oxidase subunit 2